METRKKAVVLLSGGMDSAALLWRCVSEDGPEQVVALSVNYGQRHARELLAAADLAAAAGVELVTVDLSDLRRVLSGSALTSAEVEVPEGHYAEESMRATVVPMRNAVFLSIACGLAWARGASLAATAVHAGDHAIYPDCRPEFIRAFSEMSRLASQGFGSVSVWAPFVRMTKADIATQGEALGVPWRLTWSCYKGGEVHCGKCGTCVERREAFALAGVADPTTYE